MERAEAAVAVAVDQAVEAAVEVAAERGRSQFATRHQWCVSQYRCLLS